MFPFISYLVYICYWAKGQNGDGGGSGCGGGAGGGGGGGDSSLSLDTTKEGTSIKFKLQSFVQKKIRDSVYISHFPTLLNKYIVLL